MTACGDDLSGVYGCRHEATHYVEYYDGHGNRGAAVLCATHCAVLQRGGDPWDWPASMPYDVTRIRAATEADCASVGTVKEWRP